MIVRRSWTSASNGGKLYSHARELLQQHRVNMMEKGNDLECLVTHETLWWIGQAR